MSAANKARIILVCGSTGSGKSAWVQRQITRARRLLVWDVTGEYAREGLTPIVSCTELVAAVRQKAGRYAFQPRSLRLFDFWCRAALSWYGATIVAEELADVTSPGKAPDGWGMLLRRGRHMALTIYAVTQRPHESDKTVVANATMIHCCKMKRSSDRAYMAREMGIEQERLDALAPLEWIESDDSGSIRCGRVSF